ncbi:endolytic transglycosylase MltG [Corynebacterium alimapuense]|uniref:Endolytic murein transglycosylase n=1 Tax=Corynebacterium alimapuense TaxID=1576874 RepID=A0A3M8K9Q5_9CORY|nr:endolytic transglycosylase MltG [Corynebacterium alimapuense]RNE49244.1 endolytic transglycosylase MltG [Corynebacterium alimapuense]
MNAKSQSHRHSRSRSRFRQEPKYVKRRQRGLAVLIASLVLIIGAVVYIGVQVSGSGSSSANDFEGNGNGVTQMVEVSDGASVSVMGPELEERGIIKTDRAFQTAAANNPDAASIQPGIYRLQEEMSATAAVEALLNQDNRVELLDIKGGSTLLDVQVIGGQNRPGIYSEISAVTCTAGSDNCVTAQELQQAGATADLTALGVPEWAMEAVAARGDDAKRIEGLIAPGQYVVNPGLDAEGILSDLLTRSATQFNDTGIVERAEALGLSPYELLISASLVEREAPAGDFDKVARVILNRLEEPMRLEFDSTVNYGLTEVEVATTDEDRAQVTPWNTYAKDGLPETPIAAVSVEAIEAMENPAEGNWLFFVTVDQDGTTLFNDTFEEHLLDVETAMESGVLDTNR